jgi:hypothetical protein
MKLERCRVPPRYKIASGHNAHLNRPRTIRSLQHGFDQCSFRSGAERTPDQDEQVDVGSARIESVDRE